MAKGHREAAPRVLDGREHDGTLAAEGRPLTTRHIAVYPRILTAANRGWSVFAVTNGRAEKRAVTVALRNTSEVAVTRGIPAGEQVILFPGEVISDGVRVHPR